MHDERTKCHRPRTGIVCLAALASNPLATIFSSATMKSSLLGAAFLAGKAFAGPVPVQTLAARDAISFKAHLAAPLPYKRSPSPAVFTPYMVRRQDEAESPLPTATDCSLVTSDPSELVYTSLGTVPEEDEVITTTIEGGPGCECANGVMAG